MRAFAELVWRYWPVWISAWSLVGVLACLAWSLMLGRQFRHERAQHAERTREHTIWMAREYRRLGRATGIGLYESVARECEKSAGLSEGSVGTWNEGSPLPDARKPPLAERSSKASPSPLPPPLPSMIAERPDPKKGERSE